jgi:DNA repair exonuclease SbcCD nuclease subunit
MTRRAACEKLSAGGLLALGLWPGALRASAKGDTRPFRFLVVNDTHYMSDECGRWLEGIVAGMKQENAEFCLVAGDLTEKGEKSHLLAVRDIFDQLRIPVHVQIGNHDYVSQTDRSHYENVFRNRINYGFRHRGWQFVGLDTTEGLRYENTTIQSPTFRWLEDHLRQLDATRPTVIFTHFPLGEGVTYRPSNAEALLERFKPFNLQAVFCGHFHGFTERRFAQADVTTNRCCALKRANHDQSKEKGYFVCTAEQGRVTRRFVEVPARQSAAG